jgi:hypothetical protein
VLPFVLLGRTHLVDSRASAQRLVLQGRGFFLGQTATDRGTHRDSDLGATLALGSAA